VAVDVGSFSVGRWITVWWAFAWRGLVYVIGAGLCSVAVGGVVGFVVGLVIASMHAQAQPYLPVLRGIGAVLGVAVSVALFPLYMRLLLRARFGTCRLAFVSEVPSHEAAPAWRE